MEIVLDRNDQVLGITVAHATPETDLVLSWGDGRGGPLTTDADGVADTSASYAVDGEYVITVFDPATGRTAIAPCLIATATPDYADAVERGQWVGNYT